MSTTVWTVQGMTCGHCVAAVTEEVSAIPGVTAVDVDLESGRVTVTADADPAPTPSRPPSTRPATRSSPSDPFDLRTHARTTDPRAPHDLRRHDPAHGPSSRSTSRSPG